MTAEQIVRALAATDPYGIPADSGSMLCVFCGGRDALGIKPVRPRKPEDHESSCLWRLAVEWVTAQDAATTRGGRRPCSNGRHAWVSVAGGPSRCMYGCGAGPDVEPPAWPVVP